MVGNNNKQSKKMHEFLKKFPKNVHHEEYFKLFLSYKYASELFQQKLEMLVFCFFNLKVKLADIDKLTRLTLKARIMKNPQCYLPKSIEQDLGGRLSRCIAFIPVEQICNRYD